MARGGASSRRLGFPRVRGESHSLGQTAQTSPKFRGKLIWRHYFAHDHFLLLGSPWPSLISYLFLLFFSRVTPSRIQHCLCRPEVSCTWHSLETSLPAKLTTTLTLGASFISDTGGSDTGLRASTRQQCRSLETSGKSTICGNTPRATQWPPICHLSAV